MNKPSLLPLLILGVGLVATACSSGDEGGEPMNTKPANFKAQEAGEANGPKAGTEVGTAQADAP